jgi:8-amino-7-oxononanoate synthase
MIFPELQEELDRRDEQGLLRRRYAVERQEGARLIVEGKQYISFCSNDYLGLAGRPELAAALKVGAERCGVGAGAAHLVSGHSAAHEDLEKKLAEFSGKPDALLFSTGYMANLGAVTALSGRGDAVFADRLNHASLNDAMQLSRATVRRYRHNDMDHLESMLCEAKGRKLVCTDAVFSMDGDRAPLPGLLSLCEKHDAWLLVDDAHGFGVMGKGGRGSLSHFGINSPRIIYMATLGKAAGVFGAFVAAEKIVIDALINNARSYIYTTAAPPALSVALLKSLELIEGGDELRMHLNKMIARLKRGLCGVKWKLMESGTAIQPLLVGENREALELSLALKERGIWVSAIRPPTVPEGTARLRITLSSAHSEMDVDLLTGALYELAR